MKTLRRRRCAELGALYHRVGGINMMRCAYCGDPRECLDHVPPLAIVDLIDIADFRHKGGVLMLLPSCFECNAFLAAKPICSFDQRVAALHEIYSRKINPVNWSDDELRELGRGLKSFVTNRQRRNRRLIAKLRGIEELLLGGRPRPTPFRGDEDAEKNAPGAIETVPGAFSGLRKVS